MIKLLLTNDDGFFSAGIQRLKEVLSRQYDLWVVAPDTEKSAISMALTLNSPLRVTNIEERVFAVNGTPADCVNLAVQKIMPQPPDFIISGMNLGENLSDDVYFSGTVGGAFSGYLYNIPSMAVSLLSEPVSRPQERFNIEAGARITARILSTLLTLDGILSVFNVNIPYHHNDKVIVTSLGLKRYRPEIIEKTDPRGRDYYWIGTGDPTYEGVKGTDIWAIQNGYISLSVLNFKMNSFEKHQSIAERFDEI
jgi:5'-nucleotidase